MVNELPHDFSERCVSGILGIAQDKQALFTYLTKAGASHPGATEIIKTVLLATLGQAPAILGNKLTEQYARTWAHIVQLINERSE